MTIPASRISLGTPVRREPVPQERILISWRALRPEPERDLQSATVSLRRGVDVCLNANVVPTLLRVADPRPKTGFMGRENLQHLDADRGHEPERSRGR